MKTLSKISWLGCSLAGLLLASCSSRPAAVADYDIVPLPLVTTVGQSSPFVLKSGTPVCYPAGNEQLQKNAAFLADYLKTQTGIRSEEHTSELQSQR